MRVWAQHRGEGLQVGGQMYWENRRVLSCAGCARSRGAATASVCKAGRTCTVWQPLSGGQSGDWF